MFTVKICNQGHSKYFETDAVDHEMMEDQCIMIRFTAQSVERRIILPSPSGNMACPSPDGATIAERAYIMNGYGKTIEVIR